MGQSNWPVAADLSNALTVAGVSNIPPTLDLSSLIAASISEFEGEVGLTPFLRETADFTAKFAPDSSGRIDFGQPWWTVSTVTLNGEDLALGTDFRLFPLQPPYRGLWLEDGTNLAIPDGEIEVTGRRGLVDLVPDDAWRAVLNLSFALAVEALGSSAADISEVKQGDVTIKYRDSAGASNIRREFQLTASRYRIPDFGANPC